MQTLPLPLTLADLEELLAGAADTHLRLPVVRRGPRPPRSGWPDPALYAPAPWLTYSDDRPRGTLAPPDPRAIDRMDVVLGWLSELSQRHKLGIEWARLLWARANGFSYQRIADKVSWQTRRPCSWSTARRKHQHALEALLVIATEAGRAQSKPSGVTPYPGRGPRSTKPNSQFALKACLVNERDEIAHRDPRRSAVEPAAHGPDLHAGSLCNIRLGERENLHCLTEPGSDRGRAAH